MKKIVFIVLAIMAICHAGCKKDDSVNSTSANVPVIANTTNAFTFSLTAKSYTANAEYNLSFSTDSLACSLTVVNQTEGNASLKIIDSANSTVYGDSVLTNKVVAFTQANKGIPKNITLVFKGYTGTLTFALARNNSPH